MRISSISTLWARDEPLRRRILRILALAAFLLATTVGGLLVTEELQDRRKRLGDEILSRVKQVEREFMDFFRPLSTCLEIIGKWGTAGVLNPRLPDETNNQIAPLLDVLPQVSSVEFDSPGSPSSLVIRTEDGWQARPLTPEGSDLYSRLGIPVDGETSSDPEIGWHFPEILRHENTVGAVATTQWQENGQSWLVGINVTFGEIKKLVEALPTEDSAEVVWLTERGEVVRLMDLENRVAGGHEEDSVEAGDGTVVGLMAEFLQREATNGEEVQHFRFTHENRAWWCAIYPSGLDGRFIRIGLAVPEDRLVGAVEREREILGLVVAGLLAAGVLTFLVLNLTADRSGDQVPRVESTSDSSGSWLQELIEIGETEQVEFKSSMRWNTQKGRPGKEVEFSWLKTLVAFLNTEGGTLIIGVDDQKNTLGFEIDQFPNEDRYLLHFNNLIKEHIGLEYSPLITFDLTPLGDKQVLVVQIKKSDDPVFLKKGSAEEFYVRVGPGSRKLTTRQVLEYLKARQ